MPDDRDEAELRRRAREFIRGGRLPAVPPSIDWKGPGSGRICALCGDSIGRDQMECEIEVMAKATSRDKYVFHAQCYLLWELERRQAESPDPKSAAGQSE